MKEKEGQVNCRSLYEKFITDFQDRSWVVPFKLTHEISLFKKNLKFDPYDTFDAFSKI